MRYLSLAIIVFAFAMAASAQTQALTAGTNYGLHYLPYTNAIRITMQDPRSGQADPASEFIIIVNWYGAAADGSVMPQRLRQTVERFSVRPGEAATWRFTERSRAGEYAAISVTLNFTVDPPEPDADPPDPDAEFEPYANVVLVNNEKSLIGLLLPAVQVYRKSGEL